MVQLTEKLILARARAHELGGVKALNCWGSELTDVSILKTVRNVEVINASVNKIEKLDAFSSCYNLKELYLRKNNIKSIEELSHLSQLKNLRLLWLSGNPFCESLSDDEYRLAVLRILPQLQKLDNNVITSAELQKALQNNLEATDKEESSSDHEKSCEDCSSEASIILHESSPGAAQTSSSNEGTSHSKSQSDLANNTTLHSSAGGDCNNSASERTSPRECALDITLEETNQLRLQLGLKPISAEKYNVSSPQPFKPPRKHKKHGSHNNILNASLSLVKELDQDSLMILQDAVQKRLDRTYDEQVKKELVPS